MAKKHAIYDAKEKAAIVLAVLTGEKSIQKIAKEKDIVPTLVSLWKKQAVDAINDRFTTVTRGRRKATTTKAEVKEDGRVMRGELRKARARATRAEHAMESMRERLSALENAVEAMTAALGCKMVKVRRARGRKASKA